MRAAGFLLCFALALIAWQKSAHACSAVGPDAALLSAPSFEDETRIDWGYLDVTCQDGEPARCSFRARYRVAHPSGAPSRAVVVLVHGSELRVHAGRDVPSVRNGPVQTASFETASNEISVEGSWELELSVNPCVGPGYMARHRTLGGEGREPAGSFRYVVPSRSVRHHVRVAYPRDWSYAGSTASGELTAHDTKAPLAIRALREATDIERALESGLLDEGEWTEVKANTIGRAEHDGAFRMFHAWLSVPPAFIHNAGIVLGAGYRFGVGRPWLRLGYELAAPSFLVEAIGVESDLRDNWLLVPSLELVGSYGHGAGDSDGILGAGVGVPIEVSGESRVFGRAFVTASYGSFGLMGSLDFAPAEKDFAGNVLAAAWF